jgi:beta-glucosidase
MSQHFESQQSLQEKEMAIRISRRDFAKVALSSLGLATRRVVIVAALAGMTAPSHAQGLPPDAAQVKARATEAKMTDDERFGLLRNLMVVNFKTRKRDDRVPKDMPQLAGWTQGVPRLGIPDLLFTDASLGITNPSHGRVGPDGKPDSGTALPAGMAMGSSWNVPAARRVGAMLAAEAKQRGFNIHLGGGVTLVREVLGGRNFEYFSEDPLLSGLLGGEVVAGTQANGVMATLKHLSMNNQETNKFRLDARIDPAAHRESDLLAFQIAIERGHPGTLMCGYNKVNGAYNCGNGPLLQGQVKGQLKFPGFIHSDWQAVYGWEFAGNGLDMQSGAQLDEQEWFDEPLRRAVAEGKVPRARISDMVRRILYAVYVSGIDKWQGPQGTPDLAQHRALALDLSRQGVVLLKNDKVLPLAPPPKATIAVIGGFGHLGQVLGGGGSSLMEPIGGTTLDVRLGGEGLLARVPNIRLIAPGPVQALQEQFPDATIIYDDGLFPERAALLARRSDVVILNLIRYEGEGYDNPSMALPWGQDALADAVLSVKPGGIVVLQTGSAVSMPWRNKAGAILQAWYQGQAGATAVAEIIAGKTNPSGRLPVTWYESVEQTPRPKIVGAEIAPGSADTVVEYKEGAEVGYRWMAKTGKEPLYPFGHGLTYTRFAYSDFVVKGGDTVRASFTVRNIGDRPGADVPQVYLTEANGETRQRLLGFDRVELKPGESRNVTITADPRLIARFDGKANTWRIGGGSHRIVLGPDAQTVAASANVTLRSRSFGH